MTAPPGAPASATVWWCELAWLPPGRVAARVAVHEADGVITAVEEDVAAPPAGARRLRGLVLPGLANAHSHAFHRALRGRTHDGAGDFWTWRRQMYAVAERLDPDRYRSLARAVYAEMALAGITRVGEFHYLHHGPGGVTYDDPNAMGVALATAADEAGLRITLLDTCYLTGGLDQPLEGVQRRFGDGDADAWADRVGALATRSWAASDVVVGAAVHSVRAVPRHAIPTVVAWAAAQGAPLHVHVSEQPAENAACLAAHGLTPTGLLAATGALGPRTTAVHATHLTDDDVAQLGGSGTGVCLCPTTERDLADGVGPARRLLAAGAPISLGTDSHAVIDLLEEARAMELDERLVTGRRGHWPVADLLRAAAAAGHRALGDPSGGQVAVGAPADLVAVRLDSPRTVGAYAATAAATVVYAATAADVTDVVISGEEVVTDGQHRLGDVGVLLQEAIEEVGGP